LLVDIAHAHFVAVGVLYVKPVQVITAVCIAATLSLAAYLQCAY
jgi:hypothetical protein